MKNRTFSKKDVEDMLKAGQIYPGSYLQGSSQKPHWLSGSPDDQVKLINHFWALARRGKPQCFIMAGRTDTKIFKAALECDGMMCFLPGRLVYEKVVNATTSVKKESMYGTIVVMLQKQRFSKNLKSQIFYYES
jgi:hypothetical protein